MKKAVKFISLNTVQLTAYRFKSLIKFMGNPIQYFQPPTGTII